VIYHLSSVICIQPSTHYNLPLLTREDFRSRFGDAPVIGMVHLLPLPGSPRWGGDLSAVIGAAIADATAIHDGGAAAMAFENFGDVPFPKTAAPETIAAMTAVVAAATRDVDCPFGINVLRNDPLGALAIAAATGASFVRVNVHTGAMLTDQGMIEGVADRTVRKRRELGLGDVAIFADHLVKHAVPFAPADPLQSARDLRFRGMADAILVTGSATGATADEKALRSLRDAMPETPLVVASGVTADHVTALRGVADAVIVGTSIKRDGVVSNPVDPDRVRTLVGAFRG